jgi:hypothetical protein
LLTAEQIDALQLAYVVRAFLIKKSTSCMKCLKKSIFSEICKFSQISTSSESVSRKNLAFVAAVVSILLFYNMQARQEHIWQVL